jgi:hypothetical protein
VELVSVLIPAWNADAWLAEAIESALAQTHGALEILVVDDGSDDRTPEVLAAFGERVRWESTPRRGAGSARNRLLERAHGEWLQFLDADDLLLPRKIERQLAAARHRRGGADLVVSPFLDERGRVQRAPGGRDPWADFLGGRMGTTSSHLFRRAPLVQAGGWDPARRAAQEQELLGRLLAAGARVAVEPEALTVKRRVNPESLWRAVWRDDPKAAREADVSVVAQAVRHLRGRDGLDAGREAAAGARFLLMARSALRRGAGGAQDVLDEAARLGLGAEALLSESPLLYRALFRTRGFAAAEQATERARALGPRTRRRVQRGRKRLVRALRRLGPRR